MRIEFSKVELSGPTPFIRLEVNSADFKQKYLNYEDSSHMSYPSPWAAAIYFSKVLESFTDRVNASPKQRLTAKLLDIYLKGIFLGIITPEKVDIRDLPTKLKENLKEQFPLSLNQQFNPVQRGYILMLRYRDYYVAFEYPDCFFSPAAYFSNWPDEPQGIEREMIQEIENSFSALSPEVKGIFKQYISALYNSYPSANSPWAIAFGGLEIDGNPYSRLPRFDGPLERVCFYPFGVSLRYQNEIKETLNIRGNPTNLLVYSPLGVPFEGTHDVTVRFSSGSIKINVSIGGVGEENFEIKEGCLGRDEKYYLLEDVFQPIYRGNLRIEICDISPRPYEGTGPWLMGTQYKTARLVVKDIASCRQLGSLDVRLIRWQDLFVDKLIKIDGQTPDCALKKVFARANKGGKQYGFNLIKRKELEYEIPGVCLRIYNNDDAIEASGLTLAVWPDFYFEKWKPYFIYFSPGSGKVGLKLINEKSSPDPSNPPVIQTANQKAVKKVAVDFFEFEPAITFKDINNREIGSFNIKGYLSPVASNANRRENIFGVDFGTSSTVVSRYEAAEESQESEVLQLKFDPMIIFGKKEYIDIHDLPIGQAVELPSLLYINNPDGRIINFNLGFEETTLIFDGTRFFEEGYQADRLKSQLKWKGTREEIASYLYLLSLLIIRDEYSRSLPHKIKFIFSYPLSFSKDQFDKFKDSVRLLIQCLRNEFTDLFSGPDDDIYRFVSETDVISSVNYGENDTLVIDMGGGSSDLVYITYADGEKKYNFIDSLQIAGEKVLDKLSIVSHIDKHKLQEKIKNGSYGTELRDAIDTSLDDFKKYMRIILQYALRNLSAMPGAGGNMDNINRLNFNIVLSGNGWKLFDAFKIDRADILRGIFPNASEIYYNIEEAKIYLAKNLPYSWDMGSLDAHSGRKAVFGLSLIVAESPKSWNDEIPCEIHNKQVTISRPRDPSLLNEIRCFDLEESNIAARFVFKGDLLGRFSANATWGLIKSPLAKLVEWKGAKLMS
jgi:hypothetical protein